MTNPASSRILTCISSGYRDLTELRCLREDFLQGPTEELWRTIRYSDNLGYTSCKLMQCAAMGLDQGHQFKTLEHVSCLGTTQWNHVEPDLWKKSGMKHHSHLVSLSNLYLISSQEFSGCLMISVVSACLFDCLTLDGLILGHIFRPPKSHIKAGRMVHFH